MDTDMDDAPLSATTLAAMRPVPAARRARLVTGLSQADFAATYGIPLATLRDWEQGRSEPDGAAKAYLTAITHDPTAVARAYRPPPAPSRDGSAGGRSSVIR